MQIHLPPKPHQIRHGLQVVPSADDRQVVEAAQRRLHDDPGDPDALFAVAAWDEIAGSLEDAMDLLNRLIRRRPDYPGVWWLRARVLKDLGREADAKASERIARLYAESDFPQSIRRFPL